MFPFGHGLGYTGFDLGAVSVSGPDADGAVMLEVPVTNAGSRAGAAVVQVYVAPPDGPVARPARELKGFAKLALAAGESAVARIVLSARAFAFWGQAGQFWQVAAGEYRPTVGFSSADIRGEALVICPARRLAV